MSMLRKRFDDNARNTACKGATQTGNRSKAGRNKKRNRNCLNKLSLSVRSGWTAFVLSVPKENSQIDEKYGSIFPEGIKKPQTADSRCAEMIQKPRNLSQKHSLRSTCKNRFFVAIPIIKTAPDSVERRSGFVQRSFHCALRCAMCATKTYMLGVRRFIKDCLKNIQKRVALYKQLHFYILQVLFDFLLCENVILRFVKRNCG